MGRIGARGVTRERGGERQAPAATACAPRLAVSADAATVGRLLRLADGGTRERLVGSLQQNHGNAALRHLVESPGALPVQRWAVGLARGTTDCDRILDYVASHSPYGATTGLAETKATFTWDGTPKHLTGEGGELRVKVGGPSVAARVTVDMPQWAPTDPGIRAAWSGAMAELRAHERVHEGIAAEWKATLAGRLASFSAVVPDRTEASFRAAVAPTWDGWVAEHAAAQAAIDPYEATFTCPAPAEASSEAPAG